MINHNLFQGIPRELPEELQQTLAAGKSVRIERIVSRGHCSPPGFWYDQEEDEFVLLIQGEARLELCDPGVELHLRQGDWLVIAAHRRHRVVWTSSSQETIWLAVFYTPVTVAPD